MLIVGLGNPGLEYKNTYHNVGFMVLDALLARLQKTLKEKGCGSHFVKIFAGGKKVIIAKPQTYMNLSGRAVKELLNSNGLKPEQAVVIFDELDIPAGNIRIRKCGSGGTHNGIKNIVEFVGQNIPRIRVGIGRPPAGWEIADYVLANIRRENEDQILDAVERTADALLELINGESLEQVMNKYND